MLADTVHPAFDRIDHRPWPHPVRPWAWRQSWRDLLFAHWPIAPEVVRPLIPPELEVDVRNGVTWVGVVPFRMTGVMRRPLPDLPWVSAFPELNLRLYVTWENRPGVWFVSLDAGNRLAVWAARRYFHLPYHHAAMSLTPRAGRIEYRSERFTNPQVGFAADYGPTAAVCESRLGTLEHWLTERYRLYARSCTGVLYHGEVHHRPWPLQQAVANVTRCDLTAPHGFTLDGPPPLLHFAQRIDVVVWPLEPVMGGPTPRPAAVNP